MRALVEVRAAVSAEATRIGRRAEPVVRVAVGDRVREVVCAGVIRIGLRVGIEVRVLGMVRAIVGEGMLGVV